MILGTAQGRLEDRVAGDVDLHRAGGTDPGDGDAVIALVGADRARPGDRVWRAIDAESAEDELVVDLRPGILRHRLDQLPTTSPTPTRTATRASE